MKLFAFVGPALLAVSLSACVVEDGHHGRPGYRGTTNVEYNHYDDRDHYRSDRRDGDRWHCPPGQAKKGNC